MKTTSLVNLARPLLSLFLTILLIASIIGCTSASTSNTPTPTPTLRMLQVGNVAPDFTLDTLDGTHTLRLSDFYGKTILLSFWDINCSPCIKQLSVLQKFYAYQQSIGKPFAVLSVNIDKVDKFVDIAALQQHLALTFPILVDDHYQARNHYLFTEVPISYFIDSHRYIRAILTHAFDETTLRNTLSRITLSS